VVGALLLSLALGVTALAAEKPSPAGLGVTAGVPRGLRLPGHAARQASPETIAEVRVHGNHLTSDAEIVKLSGLTIGAEVEPTTLTDITSRLRASKKFEDVTVLKRFASIADPSQIVIVIIVNEGPVRIAMPDLPTDPIRIVKRGGLRNLMFLPILDAEDGYGVTYGVRLALVGIVGERSRVSLPFSWGGFKQAGLELDKTLTNAPLSRIEIGGAVQRQENPAFQENDDRRRAWVRVERGAGPVRAGGGIGWQHVSFAGADENIRSVGADLTLDTRIDPILPRNAVYAVASWERLTFASGGATNRTRVEGRGYLGLIRQTVLVLRAVREDADRPLPLYLKSLLGGWSSLRGFKAGSFVGDSLVSGSVELRMPLDSPLDVAKLGVSIFVDAGAAYDKGQRFADRPVERGIGASVWLTAAVFRMSLSVAHGRGATTRVNFGAGLTF
jgi:outer membrane protein assembly factor BamA